MSQTSLDVVNSSYSKKGLYSENEKLLPKRSSVLNYRGQRTKLVSPNTVSSPSKNHCKGIIKAISVKVITKGLVIVYQYRIWLGGGGVRWIFVATPLGLGLGLGFLLFMVIPPPPEILIFSEPPLMPFSKG